MAELYPQHIKDFIIANNQNKSLIEITDLINSNFNTNYTYTQIKRLRAKLKIISGITGRFEKGHIPHNLGKVNRFCKIRTRNPSLLSERGIMLFL